MFVICNIIFSHVPAHSSLASVFLCDDYGSLGTTKPLVYNSAHATYLRLCVTWVEPSKPGMPLIVRSAVQSPKNWVRPCAWYSKGVSLR